MCLVRGRSGGETCTGINSEISEEDHVKIFSLCGSFGFNTTAMLLGRYILEVVL